MKKKLIIGIVAFSILVALAGLAWAYSPVPICYYSAPQVCTIVSPSTPLPTVVISP